jgi:DNA polymerase III delta subunit
MITFLTGENSFEIEVEIKSIVSASGLVPEIIDGSAIDLNQLSGLLTGISLFSDKRLIIIKNLSDNTQIWTDFADWLIRVSEDINLVLVDTKPDKRTRTYKELQKLGVVKEHTPWTERDSHNAIEWVTNTAKSEGLELNKKCAQLLIDKIGFDQWQLWHGIIKLSLLGKVDEQIINDIIDANPSENVFNLFESALRSDRAAVSRMIRTLELTEDPFRMFGLLSGQAYQLATLSVSDDASSIVAKDLGAHPYALSKLSPYAKKLGRSGARKVISLFSKADDDMKISAGDPWLLIERALLGVADV